MKTVRIIFLIVVVVILGSLIWFEKSKAPTQGPPAENKIQEDVVVDKPHANEEISSPLAISGKAKGSWFFEASFPVSLEDANGSVLAQGVAKAQGDWTTENYVPFIATLVFTAPTSTTGHLVFKNDNPSGLPENQKYFYLPVTFSKKTSEQPAGTCAPNLSDCKGDAKLCMETSRASVCN